MPRSPGVKKDSDIYSDSEREEEMDEDEISPGEAGFMEGYEHGKRVVCDACGKSVSDQAMIEADVRGIAHFFCGEKCLASFKKAHPR